MTTKTSSSSSMAIAAIGQICSTASMQHNLEQCVKLVAQAARGNAKMLFLPEAADYIAPTSAESLSLARPQAASPFVQGLCAAAATHDVAIHVGIHEPAGARLLNRAVYITREGILHPSASYDKMHVFDYAALRESATTQPGTRLTPPFDSPVGRIGSLICFDVRFAEVALALAQPRRGSAWWERPAQVVTYPSAFTLRTGKAHWEVLLRARAVETQAWVVASAQVGRHNVARASYGTSLVVDPWGEVRVRLGGARDDDGEADDGAVGQIGFVDLDLDLVERVRCEMPLQRRFGGGGEGDGDGKSLVVCG